MSALEDSSRCDFVLVDPGGARGGDLFLEIRPDFVAVNRRTAVLLFEALDGTFKRGTDGSDSR